MNFRKLSGRFVLAGLLVVALASALYAEVGKPFVSLTARSYNDFIGAIDLVGKTAENPALASTVDAAVRWGIGADLAEAFDLDGIVGVVVLAVDGSPTQVACLPLEDPYILAEFFAEKAGVEEIEERDDGVIVVGDQFSSLCFMPVDGYTLVASEEDALEVFADGLGDYFALGEDDSITIVFDWKLFPQELKDVFTQAFAEGVERGGEQLPDESDEDYEARVAGSQYVLRQLKSLQESIDRIILAIRVEEETRNIVLDIKATFIPDSSLAEILARAKDVTPRFTGFAQLDALYGGYSVEIVDQVEMQKKQYSLLSEGFHSAAGAELDESSKSYEVVTKLQTILDPLMEELLGMELARSAFAFTYAPGDSNAVVAIETEKTAVAEKAFADLLDFIKSETGEVLSKNVTYTDTDSIPGVTFQVCELTFEQVIALANAWGEEEVSLDEEGLKTAREFYGEKVRLVMGSGDGACFLGIGNDPTALFKKARDLDDENAQHLIKAKFSLKQIFELCRDVTRLATTFGTESDTKQTAMLFNIMVEILQSVPENKIVITGDCDETSVSVEMRCEEGVTKLLGSIPSLIMMMSM
ncbi:MAG: hypothetical protein Q4D38_05315 [Planctomycetia bacterium]|nr:hypothetical protein [Planctomycetia bacterium]